MGFLLIPTYSSTYKKCKFSFLTVIFSNVIFLVMQFYIEASFLPNATIWKCQMPNDELLQLKTWYRFWAIGFICEWNTLAITTNCSHNEDCIPQAFGRVDRTGSTDYTEYCLAHLFTAYAFSNGVLGLAYIASSSRNTYGGICSSCKSGLWQRAPYYLHPVYVCYYLNPYVVTSAVRTLVLCFLCFPHPPSPPSSPKKI